MTHAFDTKRGETSVFRRKTILVYTVDRDLNQNKTAVTQQFYTNFLVLISLIISVKHF